LERLGDARADHGLGQQLVGKILDGDELDARDAGEVLTALGVEDFHDLVDVGSRVLGGERGHQGSLVGAARIHTSEPVREDEQAGERADAGAFEHMASRRVPAEELDAVIVPVAVPHSLDVARGQITDDRCVEPVVPRNDRIAKLIEHRLRLSVPSADSHANVVGFVKRVLRLEGMGRRLVGVSLVASTTVDSGATCSSRSPAGQRGGAVRQEHDVVPLVHPDTAACSPLPRVEDGPSVT
jgi:hypothetical protein